VPVGSTLAETRRQLVLKTFASTNGDLDRTAKTIGLSVLEVRGELQALLERRSPRDGQDGPGDDARAPEPDVDRAEGGEAERVESRPVVLPPDAASPIGKAAAKPSAAARSRKAG
jgi:hypothetical protein